MHLGYEDTDDDHGGTMKLEQVAQALRATGEIARAGEQVLDTLGPRRHGRLLPLILGIGIGVGVGVLVFHDKTRDRVKSFLTGQKPIRVESKPSATPAEARPS
jgi:hypothetical protein